MMTGMRAVPQALEEVISCLGGGVRRVLTDAVLPFIAPTVLAVFFFLFMRSMVTLSAVIFLVTPDLDMASVFVMHLNQAGFVRSEERRLGNECGSPCISRWWPDHEKKNRQTS